MWQIFQCRKLDMKIIIQYRKPVATIEQWQMSKFYSQLLCLLTSSLNISKTLSSAFKSTINKEFPSRWTSDSLWLGGITRRGGKHLIILNVSMPIKLNTYSYRSCKKKNYILHRHKVLNISTLVESLGEKYRSDVAIPGSLNPIFTPPFPLCWYFNRRRSCIATSLYW